jgi:hypothetical protein
MDPGDQISDILLFPFLEKKTNSTFTYFERRGRASLSFGFSVPHTLIPRRLMSALTHAEKKKIFILNYYNF